MYIRAADFLKDSGCSKWQKNEWIVLHQKRQTQIYTSIFKFC